MEEENRIDYKVTIIVAAVMMYILFPMKIGGYYGSFTDKISVFGEGMTFLPGADLKLIHNYSLLSILLNSITNPKGLNILTVVVLAFVLASPYLIVNYTLKKNRKAALCIAVVRSIIIFCISGAVIGLHFADPVNNVAYLPMYFYIILEIIVFFMIKVVWKKQEMEESEQVKISNEEHNEEDV